MRNLLRRALTVGLLAGLGTMTAAPAALASTTVEAYGIQATGLVTITRQPDATLSTPSPSNVATATVASVTAAIGSLVGLNTQAITTTCTASDGENTTGAGSASGPAPSEPP